MTDAKLFDENDENSPFLSFVRREFHQGRGTEFRKSLSRKTEVDRLLPDFRIRPPRKLAILNDIADLADHDLPDLFVLKYANGWAARGVMLLQKVRARHYFCHLRQKSMSLEQICTSQTKIAKSFSGQRSWIVEEMVESIIPGKPIPLDYKFYCFRDAIGLVVQIDRNCYPPKVSLLDEWFAPLRHKTDYVLLSKNSQLGIPLIPLHALEFLDAARELSCFTDSPFVSIDLYDSSDGPVFGEFTFSPGGTHRRMWVYSRAFLAGLDSKFAAAEAMLAKNGRTLPSATADPVAAIPAPEEQAPLEYGALASSVLNGFTRAAERLSGLCTAANPNDPRSEVLARSWRHIAKLIAERQKNSLEDRRRFVARHS